MLTIMIMLLNLLVVVPVWLEQKPNPKLWPDIDDSPLAEETAGNMPEVARGIFVVLLFLSISCPLMELR